MSEFFPIDKSELNYLSQRDRELGKAIKLIGALERKIYPGAFRGLAHAICGQQISGKVHQKIWERLNAVFPLTNPLEIASASPEDLKKSGLSLRKARYIHNIAQLFANNELVEEEFEEMEDDILREKLVSLPGVGSWTVEMLLIFTFKRKNILSRGDLGIQKGLRMLYDKDQISREDFEVYFDRFSPLASIASFYLWEIASGKYPLWKDSLRQKSGQKELRNKRESLK